MYYSKNIIIFFFPAKFTKKGFRKVRLYVSINVREVVIYNHTGLC